MNPPLIGDQRAHRVTGRGAEVRVSAQRPQLKRRLFHHEGKTTGENEGLRASFCLWPNEEFEWD